MKKIRVLKRDVGKWCYIYFDDIGIVQSLITETPNTDGNLRVFIPALKSLELVYISQVKLIGNMLTVPEYNN